ncbi:Hypothetical protein NocV09_03200490 [Nannochloropsis oceanica]
MAPYYDPEAGRYVMLAYALLICINGIVAWIRVRCKVLLVSSMLSSACLFVAFGLSWVYPAIAFSIGAIIAANLGINFALRVQAVRKFFPPGLLLLISSGVFVFLCILAVRASPTKGLRGTKVVGGNTRTVTSSGAPGAAGATASGRRGLLKKRPLMVPMPVPRAGVSWPPPPEHEIP